MKKTAFALATAVMAAGAWAEQLWPGPDTVMRAQADSSIATLADGSVGVTTGVKASWPGVRMDFAKGEADLSIFNRFTVTVSNTTHETRTVHLSVKGRAVQGQGPGGSVVLKPHETGNIVALVRALPWTLDAPLKLEGMNGYPAAKDGAGGGFDIRHTTSFHIFFVQDGVASGFSVLRVTADRGARQPKVLDAKTFLPFVDRFGQFIHDEWPGKVHDEAELKRTKADEDAWLAANGATPIPDADRFGGWAGGPQLKATGHFRTEKVDGKWWLITPEGHLFFSVGLDVTRVMTDISNGKLHPDWYESPVPADGKMAFTIWNLEKKFGKKAFEDEYYDFVLKRFDSWGLNTIGNWSARELCLKSRKPYVMSVLERAKGVKRHSKFHIYDFSAPDFEQKFRRAIRDRFAEDPALAHAAKDPMCIGFFVDNELQFHKWIPDVGEGRAASGVDLYFRICKEELERAAPGKLYLGSRFVGFRQSGILWRTAAKYCDVITVNAYANSVYNLSEKMFTKGFEKPILVGEFHFGCFDRGMFKPGLAPVWSQTERARSYVRFVEGCLQHPLIVGCHWFQYRDQPLLGRGDGEAYEIGFVDVCDRPYPELTRAARAVGESMYEKRKNGVW